MHRINSFQPATRKFYHGTSASGKSSILNEGMRLDKKTVGLAIRAAGKHGPNPEAQDYHWFTADKEKAKKISAQISGGNPNNVVTAELTRDEARRYGIEPSPQHPRDRRIYVTDQDIPPRLLRQMSLDNISQHGSSARPPSVQRPPSYNPTPAPKLHRTNSGTHNLSDLSRLSSADRFKVRQGEIVTNIMKKEFNAQTSLYGAAATTVINGGGRAIKDLDMALTSLNGKAPSLTPFIDSREYGYTPPGAIDINRLNNALKRNPEVHSYTPFTLTQPKNGSTRLIDGKINGVEVSFYSRPERFGERLYPTDGGMFVTGRRQNIEDKAEGAAGRNHQKISEGKMTQDFADLIHTANTMTATGGIDGYQGIPRSLNQDQQQEIEARAKVLVKTLANEIQYRKYGDYPHKTIPIVNPEGRRISAEAQDSISSLVSNPNKYGLNSTAEFEQGLRNIINSRSPY